MTDTPTQPLSTQATPTFITPEALLAHWQGHQRLTRRTLEAFPKDQLFSFTPAPPMRSFGELALEVVQMIEPTVRGLWRKEWVTARYWQELKQQPAPDKVQLLELWDQAGEYLREHWPHIPAGRFHEVEAVFGMPPTPLKDLVLYQIDNEVHHRAQGYVYLRLLGVEPPAFWER